MANVANQCSFLDFITGNKLFNVFYLVNYFICNNCWCSYSNWWWCETVTPPQWNDFYILWCVLEWMQVLTQTISLQILLKFNHL